MSNVAILVGSSQYTSQQHLPCCIKDVEVIGALLELTGRYGAIHRVLDPDADTLKARLRSALKECALGGDIFFYFSGHGYTVDGEFYFCPRDFDASKPNHTGLSRSELLALMRDVEPKLVVNVIDACNSGSQMIKASGELFPRDKGSLNSLIQIASCQETETSLSGDPLSEFTDSFCRAAIEKDAGPVYYTDIVAILRDDYLQNSDRTPYFVFQTSARDTFVDDATCLAPFKASFEEEWHSASEDDGGGSALITQLPSLIERLQRADQGMATPEDITTLVDRLFDGVTARLTAGDFAKCFEVEIVEHSDFKEDTTRSFIIRNLANEKRPDDFVTATIKQKSKKPSLFDDLNSSIARSLMYPDDYFEEWNLYLNARMDRAQIKVTLTPLFKTLQKIILVVSCAPSLENCYVFELATRHPRTDWETFSSNGAEIVRHWYKLRWKDDVQWLIDGIANRLDAAIQAHLDAVASRISKE